jgi:hypothetical protein
LFQDDLLAAAVVMDVTAVGADGDGEVLALARVALDRVRPEKPGSLGSVSHYREFW